MPKRTVKYLQALEYVEYLGITDVSDQEALYRSLQERGYFWDVEEKVWKRTSQPADPPTQLIRIRVWSESTKIEETANRILTVLQDSGFELIERSQPYVCRPPKHLESRIYLSFRGRD